ncbi:MAG: hypothetical protein OXG62_15290 [Nitrospinae bacterium]|nr:hypothetical protein [Nitrospinota bacterium]
MGATYQIQDAYGNEKRAAEESLKNLDVGGFAVIPAFAGMTIKSEEQNHLSASGGAVWEITFPLEDFFNNPFLSRV